MHIMFCFFSSAILIFCWIPLTCCRVYTASSAPGTLLPDWAIGLAYTAVDSQGLLNAVVFANVSLISGICFLPVYTYCACYAIM